MRANEPLAGKAKRNRLRACRGLPRGILRANRPEQRRELCPPHVERFTRLLTQHLGLFSKPACHTVSAESHTRSARGRRPGSRCTSGWSGGDLDDAAARPDMNRAERSHPAQGVRRNSQRFMYVPEVGTYLKTVFLK